MTPTHTVEMLEHAIASCDDTTPAGIYHRIDLLNQLAWELSDLHLKRSIALSELTFTLATAPGHDVPSYQAGIAYSLRTQGYLKQRLGDYSAGMSQLLTALNIFTLLQADDGLADVFDSIAGIYAQIGDFPEMLNYTCKELEAAQRIGDQRRIANAYNNLANVYFETGDYDQAIETLHQNLARANNLNYERLETLSHLNLAETYFRMRNYDQAQHHAFLGLHTARQVGFELFEVYAYDFLGKIWLGLDKTTQAICNLKHALARSALTHSKVTTLLILLDLGQAYRKIEQIPEALLYLSEALTTAEAINARGEIFKAHLLLAEIYEEQGDVAQALNHFKQYHAVKELVLGEKANQRLKLLQVEYETQTAKKEAEILQLRTLELQRAMIEHARIESQLEQQVRDRTLELSTTVALLRKEIAERERAEAEIRELVTTLEQRVAARTEELATFFDLILQVGQTEHFADILVQVLPRFIDVTRSQAIAIYLFSHERTALQLIAQINLPLDYPPRIEIYNTSFDFQRWIYYPNDPLLTTTILKSSNLPPTLRIPDSHTYLGSQIRIGSQVEGILNCYRTSDQGFSLDEVALVTALAQQIGMLLATQRVQQTMRNQADAERLAALQDRDAAEAASRAKSVFLASMSHELRTPLTAVIGMAALLQNTELTPEQRVYTDTIRSGGQALLAVISDILDFSRIEAGRIELTAQPFDLHACLDAAISLISQDAYQKGLAIGVERTPSVPRIIIGDEVRLRQILINLLGNAVKFTNQGAVSLHVASRMLGEQIIVTISVSDTGIGMSNEQLSRIFQPFVQADNTTARSYGGTGLGLAISQQLVSLMGGSIEATSTPMVGSTFRIVLPFMRTSLETVQVPATTVSKSVGPLRVLVVEDNPINQEVIRRMVIHLGHSVTMIGDGQGAVDAVMQMPFDVVLMDVQLPGMDGETATRRIRELGTAVVQPQIIAITASALSGDRERFLRAGMDDYLSKPIQPADIERILPRVMESS